MGYGSVIFCSTKSSICSLKTSLTKWKPDFDSAASEYAKAGTARSAYRRHHQSKTAFEADGGFVCFLS